ncbi:MAG: SUMF1/EgtB/PvdO family nonheme iron enzyme [Polyangiaceae bacterium]|nr:SUMF1/EgtB/PvdO family nonheme iron enzyme [Polyangiaceae bacterium]
MSRAVFLVAIGLWVGCNSAQPSGVAAVGSSESGPKSVDVGTAAGGTPSAEATASGASSGGGIATTAGVATSADPQPTASASATASAALPSASAAAASTETGRCPSGMIHIPGGSFKRHKPGKQKLATVKGFCLDKAEVTVLEYKECVKEKKCSPRCLEIGKCTAVPVDADWPDPMEAIRASMFCNGSRNDRDGHPVNCVSFSEAKGYCESRNKRLPTGDEWEWAVVGDKSAPIFPWGQRAPEGGDLCWGKPYKRSMTCVPGSYDKDVSRHGVVDMTGNLSEWVVDDTRSPPRAQLRGSSWYAIDDGYVQAALWGFESTSGRSEVFGFRCAKD